MLVIKYSVLSVVLRCLFFSITVDAFKLRPINPNILSKLSDSNGKQGENQRLDRKAPPGPSTNLTAVPELPSDNYEPTEPYFRSLEYSDSEKENDQEYVLHPNEHGLDRNYFNKTGINVDQNVTFYQFIEAFNYEIQMFDTYRTSMRWAFTTNMSKFTLHEKRRADLAYHDFIDVSNKFNP